ncbi:MAG TPA: glutathione transferase GstA [Gammaproteobacteria bacterium]|nr:glutathione transferase GstA [Gammaproteobacteria bacterium]
MKLYYAKGSCSLAVRILIHELNIPCEFESVDLKSKKTEHGEDYLKLNPKGSVPALLLDNNELLTENTVIQQYLADAYKGTTLLPSVGDMKRYRTLEWLNFVSTELHKHFSPFFSPNIPDELKQDVYKLILEKKLTLADEHLKNNKFLMGNFSLPDAYLFVVLRWIPYAKLDITNWPNLARFTEDMKQRKAVQTSLQEEGLS